LKSGVTFKSDAFNHAESKEYFINPYCFGDDVLRWMMEELRSNGIDVKDGPEQEDFGWYFTFSCDGSEYDFILGWRPGDTDEDNDGDWLGWLERSLGFWRSISGGRKRNISAGAVDAIDRVLRSSEKIPDVKWCAEKELR